MKSRLNQQRRPSRHQRDAEPPIVCRPSNFAADEGREPAIHEAFVAYQAAFELAQLHPCVKNWRAAVAAYDAMLAASRKAG